MTPIPDLLIADGIEIKKVSSGEYSSSCPVCGGTDRFRVWPEKGRYWCRGCGIQGDAIQYLRDVRAMSYPEACKFLGVEPKSSGQFFNGNGKIHKPTWTPAPAREPERVWREKASALMAWAEGQLWAEAGKYALEWLRSERGFTDETIRTARLGWIPKDLWRDRKAWGLPEALRE